jgi:hypothetical protein
MKIRQLTDVSHCKFQHHLLRNFPRRNFAGGPLAPNKETGWLRTRNRNR